MYSLLDFECSFQNPRRHPSGKVRHLGGTLPAILDRRKMFPDGSRGSEFESVSPIGPEERSEVLAQGSKGSRRLISVDGKIEFGASDEMMERVSFDPLNTYPPRHGGKRGCPGSCKGVEDRVSLLDAVGF